MIAIDQSDSRRDRALPDRRGARAASTGDYAIVTVPYPVLRHVEVLKPFSHAKRRAIRQLRYDASAKIFFQCRRRFWEEDDGIVGGGTRHRPADPQRLLPGAGTRDRARRAARELHLVRGRAALGLALAGRPHRAGARERRADPSAGDRRVRGRRVVDVARRPVRRRRLRAVRAVAAGRCCTSTSSRRRGASTSPASTRRSRTRGSRARSSPACARRARSTPGRRDRIDPPRRPRRATAHRAPLPRFPRRSSACRPDHARRHPHDHQPGRRRRRRRRALPRPQARRRRTASAASTW